MKLRKIFAAAAATVVASVMAVSASAYETFLMFADGDWSAQSMAADSYPAGNVDVTADGTYTVTAGGFLVEDPDTAEMVPAPVEGATVFCVDIDGLAAAKNAGKDAAGYDDCKTGADKMAFAKAAGIEVSNVIVTLKNSDGTTTDLAVNQDNIIFGDIEGNGKIRIEIYNAYGDTSANAPIDASAIACDDSISVTFTIAGVGAGSTEAGKGSSDTGVEGIAAVAGVAIVAAGAVLVSKKRK